MSGMHSQGRRSFLIGALSTGAFGTLAACTKESQEMPSTDRMPVVFVGHGTPRSAVWTNEWTASWEKLGAEVAASLGHSFNLCALAHSRRRSRYRQPRAANEL